MELQSLQKNISTSNRADIKFVRERLKQFDAKRAADIYTKTQNQALEQNEKPTKFFFDQLKKKQNKNTLSSVYVTDNLGNKTVSSKVEDILQQTTSYYRTLYTSEPNLNQNKQNNLLNLIDRHLTVSEKNNLDRDLTVDEMTEALNQTENGKAPGWDGLPFEFFKAFWNLLKQDFLEVQNAILNVEKKLTPSQERALISLLYKKGDKKDLDNWRPLSLLCTDYKILTKTLPNRIKQVLPVVIHEDQTCSVPGRSIHSNLLLTRDLIEYTKKKNIKGYILTVDQEKAFDKVDRNVVFKIMKRMNFGDKIIQWLKVIYKNPKSALYVNGHIAEIFETTRGIRQGCPLSAILYVIFAESLGNLIRKINKIIGLYLPGCREQAKIAQYADDTSFFISTRTNINYVFETLSDFEEAIGARIKPTKTKAITLKDTPRPSCDSPIKWVDDDGLEILGIHFFLDFKQTLNKNWSSRINDFQNHIEDTKCLFGTWPIFCHTHPGL